MLTDVNFRDIHTEVQQIQFYEETNQESRISQLWS